MASSRDGSRTQFHLDSRATEMTRKSACAVADHITGTAHSMQKRLRKAPVDLGAQPRDVDVDDVGLRIKMVIPNILQQHGAGHDLPRVTHQIFEQAEFTRLQQQLLPAAADFVRKPIELKITDAIDGLLTTAAAAAS